MARTVIASSGGGGGTTLTPSNGNWASGTFGTGLIRVYGSHLTTYTFTVPTAISTIRVRVWGAGGGGSSSTGAGGGGGGFAIGEFDVTAGTSYTVTVGQGGDVSTTGGTSSFGSLISATGGTGDNANSQRAGGVGTGGYINHTGGGSNNSYGGGGGAANLFGHGNDGDYNGNRNSITNRKKSGGAGGGQSANSNSYQLYQFKGGMGPFGSFFHAGPNQSTNNYVSGGLSFQMIHSIDEIATGNGGFGHEAQASQGVNGGGGAYRGDGGWPGGGGGPGATSSQGGLGADGCVIVEY